MPVEPVIIGLVTALVALCSAAIASPCWAILFSRDTARTTKEFKDEIGNLRDEIKNIKGKSKGETGVFTNKASALIAESDAMLAQLDDSKAAELEEKINKKCMCEFVPHVCIQKQAQSEMEQQWIPKLKNQIQNVKSILSTPNPCRGYKQSREVDIEGKKRKETKEEIWKMISTTEEPNVICIHGVLGVGKTALAKSIHNKALDDKHELFRYVVWVDVEHGKDDVRKVQDCIAKSLNIEFTTEEERRNTLENALSKVDSFLLVMDSMWKPMSLRDIGVPELVEMRKVIVTSRISTVCDQERRKNFEMMPLPCEDEAWDLFKKKMTGTTRSISEEMVTKKALISELDGLPLAINKFALALCNNTQEGEQINIDDHTSDNRGKKPFYLEGKDQELFNHFSRSYLFLDERVKPCFLYCALFPKGHWIYAKELIEYWMWEDLLGEFDTLEHGRTEGKKMLRELQNVHLLQRVGSGADERVKMLSLFRTMAIETMDKEGKTVCIRSGVGLTRLPPSGRHWNSKVERASFMNNKLKVLDLNGNKNCGQLLTLLLQHNPLDSDCNVRKFFGSMSNLRVLDLSQTKIHNLPDSLSKLKKLHALVLRSCSNLTKLPDLKELQHLLVLDLSDTPLEQCPLGIEKLVKLRRLDLSKTRLESFPANKVANLEELEELLMITNGNCVWGSTEDEQGAKRACVEDLVLLNKLTILEIHVGNTHALFKFARYANLLRFRFLVGDVHSGGGVSYVDDNSLSVSGIGIYKTSSKSELKLTVLDKLIKELNVLDVSNLSGLSYLFSVDILGSLTKLRELRVTRCDDMLELIQKPSQESAVVCLSYLTKMVLSELPRLKSVCCGQVMNCPALRYIQVWGCPNLKLPMIKADQAYQGSNLRPNIHIKAERSWWFNNLEWDNPGNSDPDFHFSPRSHPCFTFSEADEPPKPTPRSDARNVPKEEEATSTNNTTMESVIVTIGFGIVIGTIGFGIEWAWRNLNASAPTSLLTGATPSNGTNYSEIEIGDQRSRLDDPETSNSLIQDTAPLSNSNLVPAPKLEATARDEPREEEEIKEEGSRNNITDVHQTGPASNRWTDYFSFLLKG